LFLGSAVKEREWEYAVFRAIGGTKSQVVSMVFSEFAGSVIAAIGISLFLGVLFGYCMSILTFGVSPFSPIVGGVLRFPITMMLFILSLDGLTMLASCYIPASKAGAVDPATVLRNL
jgi:ABC-type lipoprotein release transport system permease subunit